MISLVFCDLSPFAGGGGGGGGGGSPCAIAQTLLARIAMVKVGLSIRTSFFSFFMFVNQKIYVTILSARVYIVTAGWSVRRPIFGAKPTFSFHTARHLQSRVSTLSAESAPPRACPQRAESSDMIRIYALTMEISC